METPDKEADVLALPPGGYRGTVVSPTGCMLLPGGGSGESGTSLWNEPALRGDPFGIEPAL